MRILIITPAPARSRKGNRVTALRWARILRELGHRVLIREAYQGERCDLMVALHAWRSHASMKRYRERCPAGPLVLAMTGTDLYRDIHRRATARESLELAWRLVVLQPGGIQELPAHVRSRARVIYQSVRTPRVTTSPAKKFFQVCVLGHLRQVKDPFCTARAARRLPASSKIRVLQVGAALSPQMEKRARAESKSSDRYRWVGEVPRWKAMRILAASRLLVLTSRLEGGANVISEAIAVSVPVISTRISGSIGILGPDYPGYFPVGDTHELARLLVRAEGNRKFYQNLKARCRRLRSLVDPARECRSWKKLLGELEGPP